MIEVVVVDVSAEARSRLTDRLSQFQKEASTVHTLCPVITIKPLSPHELRFHAEPDVIIIGRECLRNDLTEVASVRKIFPKTKIVADIAADLSSFLITEQMMRLGVDDVLVDATTGTEFFRKLIFFQKKDSEKVSGKLILVDSGKGGMGTTSIVAALAEAAVACRKKLAVVDFDLETQDLSRFLQSKPYRNENLDAILAQERPVIEQTVSECLYPVGENDAFLCVPPPTRRIDVLEARDPALRQMLSFFENLDAMIDATLVDVAGLRGPVYQSLLKVADTVVFVTQNDPAALFATIQSAKVIHSVLGNAAEFIFIENAHAQDGLPSSFVKSELSRQLHIGVDDLRFFTVDRCAYGGRWPASGATLYGSSRRRIQKQLQSCGLALGLIPESNDSQGFSLQGFFSRIASKAQLPRVTVHQQKVELVVEDNVSKTKALPVPEYLVSSATIVE